MPVNMDPIFKSGIYFFAYIIIYNLFRKQRDL